MIPLPFSAAEWEDYLDVLTSNHVVHVTVGMMTLDHRYLQNCTARVLDGQVTLDVTADDMAKASLTLVDPDGTLGLDAPGVVIGGALGADRMFQVVYHVSRDGSTWYSVPVFCGVAARPVRSGPTVQLDLECKSTLARHPYVTGRTFRRGTPITSVIRQVLADAGETRMDIPSLPATLGQDLVLGWDDQPWDVVARLAITAGRHLYYDGRGVARLREFGGSVLHRWDTRSMLSHPTTSAGDGAIYNAVRVLGSQPSGAGTRPTGYATLPVEHPLSPRSLARGGRDRVIVRQVEDQAATTAAACAARAKAELASIDEGEKVEFTALVMPHLEVRDLVAINLPGLAEKPFRLSSMTIPLGPDATSTIGFTQRVSTRLTTRRRRRNRR